MKEEDRKQLRQLADTIWAFAKECPGLVDQEILKTWATDLHGIASRANNTDDD